MTKLNGQETYHKGGVAGGDPSTRPLDIGVLVHYSLRPTGRPIVYGAGVAVRDFIHHLVNAGNNILLGAPAPLMPLIATDLGLSSRRNVTLKSYDALLENDELVEKVGLWLDPSGCARQLLAARSLLSKRPTPACLIHHDFSSQSQLYEWALRILLGPTYYYDAIVCPSRASKSAVLRILEYVAEGFRFAHGPSLTFRGNLILIPLGVDVTRFAPRDPKPQRLALGIPPDHKVVLYLGRLSFVDKMDVVPLIRAFKIAIDSRPETRTLLLMCGSGPREYGRALREVVGSLGLTNYVKFIACGENDRHLMFNAADIFVSPSDNIQETFGITPIEAMASGVPQVVADWDGYRDTVRNGETGYLVPTEWAPCDDDLNRLAVLLDHEAGLDHLRLAQATVVDIKEMAGALQKLLWNDELRARMAARSREIAVAEFSWGKVLERFRVLWYDLQREASRATDTPKALPAYYQPSFQQIFASYPSLALSHDTLLKVEACAEAQELDSYSAMITLGALNRDLLQTLTKVASNSCGAKIRMSDLCHCEGPPLFSHSEIVRHLMWLRKYGIVVWEVSEKAAKIGV